MMETINLLGNLGMAAGAVAVCHLFIKFLREEREDRKTERESFVETIQNHVNHNTDAVEKLTRWLEGKFGD